MKWSKFLSNPLALAIASLLGVLVGVLKPGFFKNWMWAEEIVFGLIQMTVLPIILVSLLLSVIRLFSSQLSTRVIFKIIIAFIGPLFLVAALSGFYANIFGPSQSERERLQVELGSSLEESAQKAPQSIEDKKVEYIPTNIFQALASGNLVGLLTFIFLFGAAIGLNVVYSSSTLIKILESANEALLRMFNWFLTFLAVAIMISISKTIEQVGVELLSDLRSFFVCFLSWVIIFIFGMLAYAKSLSNMNFVEFWKSIEKSLSVSFFSGSSSSALPSLMESLKEKFKVDTWVVDLIAPLSLSAFKLGSVALLAMLSVLLCQLFDIELSISSFFIIVLASVLQSICGGGEGAAAVMVLAFMLRPLGLSEEILVMLFVALRPVLSFAVAIMNTASSLAIILSAGRWLPRKEI
ncbi:MAG: cation:dicarboxylase symporter family transporter [Bdellovibrionota bacterium]